VARCLEKDPERRWQSARAGQLLVSAAAFSDAESSVLRAIELAPSLAAGHMALGAIRKYGKWDWQGAKRAYERALELAPGDAEVRLWHSGYLSAIGRPAEALGEYLQLVPQTEADSLAASFSAGGEEGLLHWFIERQSAAEETARDSGSHGNRAFGLSVLSGRLGDRAAALRWLEESVRRHEGWVERPKTLARALRCHPAVLVFPGWEVDEETAA
jgi:tetratricopeptide (TPR) repeat protein